MREVDKQALKQALEILEGFSGFTLYLFCEDLSKIGVKVSRLKNEIPSLLRQPVKGEESAYEQICKSTREASQEIVGTVESIKDRLSHLEAVEEAAQRIDHQSTKAILDLTEKGQKVL